MRQKNDKRRKERNLCKPKEKMGFVLNVLTGVKHIRGKGEK